LEVGRSDHLSGAYCMSGRRLQIFTLSNRQTRLDFLCPRMCSCYFWRRIEHRGSTLPKVLLLWPLNGRFPDEGLQH